MEAEIEKIGVLRNPVISWQEGARRAAAAARRPWGDALRMSWPRDDAKLERVRALWREHGARRARRARARQRPLPDELLGDEGVRRVRLPARGRAGAHLPRGVGGGRGAHGLDERRAPRSTATTSGDPRPPTARVARARAEAARELRARRARALARDAGGRPHGRRADDVHARRGSTRSADVADATPLLAAARALKTEQEIERMRLANEIAAAAMEHVPADHRAGYERGADRGGVGGLRPRRGHRLDEGKVELALGFSLVWSGPGIKTFTATTRPAGRRGRADAVRDLGLRRRLLVRPHEEPRPGRADARSTASSSRAAWPSTTDAIDFCATGREPGRARPADPRGHRRDAASRASRRTRSATASARARTSRRTRTRPAAARSRRGWCLQSSQDATWTGGGGLRVEDNFLITSDGRREAVAVPGWDSPGVTSTARRSGPATSTRRRSSRSRASRSASTTRRCATASRPSESCFRPSKSSRSRGAARRAGIDRIEAGFPRVSDDDCARRSR